MSSHWKPLLAATLKPDAAGNIDLSALPYPLWASPKIDGYRATVQENGALTRKGLPYRNLAVQDELWRPPFEGLDVELCVGPPWATDVFNRTQNCVNSGKPAAAEEWRRAGQVWVIDSMEVNCSENCDETFSTRHACLKASSVHWPKNFHLVPQTLVKNAAQLAKFEERCLKKGYEGVMLRRHDSGPYPQKLGKDNRSTLRECELVKLKRREFGLAKILEWFYLEHNVNEEKTAAGKRSSKKAGIVVDKTKVGSVRLLALEKAWAEAHFSATVQTEALRSKGAKWWDAQIGKTVRYSHQLIGAKDSPRQPQVTFRELL